jgi:catechol 2,3-dioxygenase-like lactoylglutathione lyase family enzyme
MDCFVAPLLAMTIRARAAMIDHVSVSVSNLERAARFYEATLAPLGLSRLVTRPATVGFGKTFPEFWINFRPEMAQVAPDSGAHICLRAKSTADVDAFHAAALGAGARSDGAPGLRPHDRVRYYAAFVRDPDGNRIEAVTFLTDAEATR